MVTIAHAVNQADAAALAELHSATVTVAYRGIFPQDAGAPTGADLLDSWRTEVANPEVTVFMAHQADTLVGSVVSGPDDTTPDGYSLRRLHVHPDHQGNGIGAVLHDRAVAAAAEAGVTKLNLWVLEANERARGMYERRGWALVRGPTFANEPPHIVDVLYEFVIATS